MSDPAPRLACCGRGSMLPLPKEIPLSARNMSRPLASPLGYPRSPHLPCHRRVPTRDHSPRPSCNEFRGAGCPLPTGRPWVPTPAGPGTRGHLRVTPRSAWRGPGSVSKVARAGANSPHAGRCPRERRACRAAPLTPRAGSAKLAPGGALLSLLPWRWSLQDASADSTGSFRACNSIVIETIHMVWVLPR